jgi:hypothetical protein
LPFTVADVTTLPRELATLNVFPLGETVGDVMLVIQRLRQHGDLKAWKTAREIEGCL